MIPPLIDRFEKDLLDDLAFYPRADGADKYLCAYSVLCVSVVNDCDEILNHRDTENTEGAQRK
jgi:hypothetical protein